MQHQEGFFQNAQQEKIYYQCWLPETTAKAILIVVHGLAEHGGRYGNVVRHFAPKGYAIYALDHVGHGRSSGQRVYVDQFATFVATLHQFVGLVREWQPGSPIFMIGHSMGGLIATHYLIDHQQEMAGAVLSGPAVKVPDNISAVTLTLGRLLSILLPKAGLLQLDANHVSRDPAVVQAYRTDPLNYTGKITARLSAEMVSAMQRVEREASRITLPVYVAQGGDDKLVDPSAAPFLHGKVSSSDKTLKVYKGLYHEILNEPEKDLVLNDVERWIEAHLAP